VHLVGFIIRNPCKYKVGHFIQTRFLKWHTFQIIVTEVVKTPTRETLRVVAALQDLKRRAL
jgi:hypothetical protein